MPMPHRTFAEVAKRRLVGKEGSERVATIRALLAELPGYRNGPYADLRKWLEGELERTRVRGKVLHRDSLQVRREGAAQIALVGPPNAGKSSLLQALSDIQIRTGDYAFTTLRPVPALTRIGGVLVQLVEIPGLIEGAHEDRGGGRALLGVLRNADAIVWCRAAADRSPALDVVRAEVAAAGIEKPAILALTKADELDDAARRRRGRRARLGAGRCEPRPAARGDLGAHGPDPRLSRAARGRRTTSRSHWPSARRWPSSPTTSTTSWAPGAPGRASGAPPRGSRGSASAGRTSSRTGTWSRCSPVRLVSVADAAAIATHGLTKRYRADVAALDGLELEVGRGEVFGFLGPNGAGKSTTIRLLLDLIRPTAGTASLLGLDARRDGVQARRRVGYLPGDLRLADRLTGREQLDSLARLRGTTRPELRDTLVERFGVTLDRPIRELSKGNRQKLGVVQAFMHRPELLILDEPTSGLDPLLQEEFRLLLRETAADGRTVFLSSHSLDEVQHAADRLALIRDGRLLRVDTVAALRAHAVRHVTVTFAEAADPAAFAGIEGVRVESADDRVVRLALPAGAMDAVVKAAARHRIVDLVSAPAQLEEIFLDLYRASPDGR